MCDPIPSAASAHNQVVTTIYVLSYLDPYAKWDQPNSLEGVVGHEQRHVKAMRKLFEHKIANNILIPIDADTIDACNQKARQMASLAQSMLRDLLRTPGNTHVNKHPGDPAYADEPIELKRYPYIALR